jgi:membrane-associated phospholipid phosphatase
VTLLALLAQVVGTVLALHVLSLAVVGVGEPRAALRAARRTASRVAPAGAVLGGVLLVNGVVRDVGVELSWLVGVNVTARIHALEGGLVADLQSLAGPPLTAYFGFVYVFGYVFLLTFPLVLYALRGAPRPLYATLVAYGLNYGVGLVCYVLFVAYGPRNFMPELVDSLLYTSWPGVQRLTSAVNVNTNVFPSLHASLSVTAAVLACRFRAVAPRWPPIAASLALSVAVATMYLGIHWLTDVLGGLVLAGACVHVALSLSADVGDERGERTP